MPRSRPKKDEDFFICPNCGAEVRVGAVVCRECGASDESGWDEDDHGWEDGWPDGYAGTEADAERDYDRFLSKEFPEYESSARRRRRLILAVAAILTSLALVAWTLKR